MTQVDDRALEHPMNALRIRGCIDLDPTQESDPDSTTKRDLDST